MMPLFKGTAGKATPKKAIDYITDPKKAVIVTSMSMDDSRDYAKQFTETCKLYGKGSKYNERKYYHFKVSPDQVDNATPQRCHELAERMARELFAAHECVTATHTDTDTVHSHIIINAVNFETGKKFHMNIGAYRDSKDLADIVGVELGFTPLDWKTKTAEKLDRIFADDEITPDPKYITHAEIQIAKRDESGSASWKEALRQAIDEAKAHCTDRAEFQQYLQDHFGVTMPRNTGKTVSFVHPAVGETYAIRGNKLGSDYTAASIDQALQENTERSSINAGLHVTEKHTASSETGAITTATDTIPATANAVSNIPVIGSQSAVQTRNGERSAPRSVSDVGAELRSLDEAVSRITSGISTPSEGINNNSAESVHGSTPRPANRTGKGVLADREERSEPSEPVVEIRKHEPSVQPKPKRRSRSDER